MRRWCVILFIATPIMVFAQKTFSGNFSTSVNFSNANHNAFWMYANTYGRMDSASSFFALGEVGYTKKINRSSFFELKGRILKGDGNNNEIRIDQLYAEYKYKNLLIDIGSWHHIEELHELSSVGGNILWSGNARAIPGAELKFLKGAQISDWLTFRGKLGHYLLGADRFVKNTQVHYKNLAFDISLSKRDKLTLELDHYAQFGGTSRTLGKQPDSFTDYLKIFVGTNGGSGATESDQINALGNHLGSYTFTYDMQRTPYDLRFYHQTIFEDTSGREFRNFPDGVWGVYFKPKSEYFFNKLLYEFVQTVSQSGKFVPPPNGNFSGGDNYFYNGMYQSGWTYKGRIIGLPFIIPEEDGRGIKINRSYVHHLGIAGNLFNFNYILKTSYVLNLGTYNKPLKSKEEAIYAYLGLEYPTQLGVFKMQLASDRSNQEDQIFTIGLGYGINF